MPPRLPPSLVRNLREGRCMLFAGAGLSAWAGLPTWRRLLEETVEEVRNETLVDDGGELDRLLERGRYLELADHCREKLGRRYTELLAERLRADDVDIPEVHHLALGLPFAGWITTNYDKLLERAYNKVRGGWAKTLTHTDADMLGTVLFDRVPFILKAHGDIDKPDSIVLTTGDYRRIIHGNPAFNATFSAILLTHAVLFVGYSLGDPDFQLLMDRQLTAFRTFVPDRYAIMPDVGEVEAEVMWRTARIKVLTYEGDHAWLLEFLRALKDEVGTREQPAGPAPATAPERRTRTTRSSKPRTGAPKPMPAAPGPAAPQLAGEPAWSLSLRRVRNAIEAWLADPSGATAAGGTGMDIRWDQVEPFFSLIHREGALVPAAAIGREMAPLLADGVRRALAEAAERKPPRMLRLSLDPELESIPWELTDVGGATLAERLPLIRAPIGITDDARGIPLVAEKPHALLIGDPEPTTVMPLPGARREVEQIAEQLTRRGFPVTLLIGEQATAQAVLDALNEGSYDIVHFAGHAWYDAVEAYIELAGGVRTTAGELRPVLGRQLPALVFFDSHYTSFLPPSLEAVRSGPGADAGRLRATLAGRSGFTDVMMRSGVGAYIGCFGSCSDDGAVEFATRVYDALLEGHMVAFAVQRARHEAAAAMTPGDATPLLYTVSGYGALKLV